MAEPGPVTPSTMQHLTPSQYILQQQGVIRVQQILGKLLLRLSLVTILSSVTTIFVERIFEGIRPSCLHEQQSFILIFGGDNLESSSSGFPCVDGNTAILSTSYNILQSYTIAQHHPSPGGGTTGRAVHDNTRLPSPPRQHGADIFLVSANIFAADGGMVGAARDGREVSSLFCTF